MSGDIVAYLDKSLLLAVLRGITQLPFAEVYAERGLAPWIVA